MSKVTVHAGDFLKGGNHEYSGGQFIFQTDTVHIDRYIDDIIPSSQLESVEIASEESVKKIGGTIGWGAAGLAFLGPVGLLAGLLLGGKKKDITFVAKFKDGRKLLATTDSATYTQLQAAVF